MPDTHPINQTLLDLMDNQVARTKYALAGIKPEVFTQDPGNSCNSIQKIGEHLIMLRAFQLMLMGSDLAKQMPAGEAKTPEDLVSKLDTATALFRRAIDKHDPADWHATPPAGREGPWADEPTLLRLVRPINDFTNHLGAVRAIRRILGDPVEQTQ